MTTTLSLKTGAVLVRLLAMVIAWYLFPRRPPRTLGILHHSIDGDLWQRFRCACFVSA